MKYKVVSEVIALYDLQNKRGLQRLFDFNEPDFLAYKIIAGLHIFYITKSTYIKGVEQGIIEPISSDLPTLPYDDMLMCRGMIVNHRMQYALKHSTIKYLKNELKNILEIPKTLTVRIYTTNWGKANRFESGSKPILKYSEEVSIDIENQEIVCVNTPESVDILFISVFRNVKTYEDFLDRLASYLDREFMNSRNIFDKYKENDFYDVDYWMQKRFKFEFIFN